MRQRPLEMLEVNSPATNIGATAATGLWESYWVPDSGAALAAGFTDAGDYGRGADENCTVAGLLQMM